MNSNYQLKIKYIDFLLPYKGTLNTDIYQSLPVLNSSASPSLVNVVPNVVQSGFSQFQH